MSKVFATLLIVFSILVAAGLGTDLSSFIDIPSVLIVFGVSTGVIIARHGFAGVKQLFDSEHNLPILPSLCFGASFAAIIANLIALIALLVRFGDPKTIGPAIAVGVLSTLYSVLLNLFGFCLNREFSFDKAQGLMMLLPILLSGILYSAVYSS